jgi:hypothetical protein
MAGNITRMKSLQKCGEKTIWKSREWGDNAKLYFKKTGVEDGRWTELSGNRGDVQLGVLLPVC